LPWSDLGSWDSIYARKGIGSDQRIGYDFLYSGCGYGGSCYPKGIHALQRTGEEFGMPMKILNAVEEVNHTQKNVLLQKITARFGNNLKGKHFALWGLAFKPGTDDMRDAPSRVVVEGLWAKGRNSHRSRPGGDGRDTAHLLSPQPRSF